MEVLREAASYINLTYIAVLIAGVIAGYVIGALPGFSATMGVALFIPFSYSMDVYSSFGFLIALYCSAVFAGSIPAILIRTPGTPAAVATIYDGYPLAKKGEAGKALGLACWASVFGGIVSGLLLICLANAVARAALAFGPQEYFALAMLGIAMVVGMSSDNIIKGFIAAAFGLLVTVVGMDSASGMPRFTFGNVHLLSGFQELPVMIGIFAISEVFFGLNEPQREAAQKQKITGLFSGIPDMLRNWKLLIYSSLMGTFLGALPGVGATTAAIVGYNQAKRTSKEPEKMGTGQPEGIIGPECANNAVTGGALIPMLALGIPGDSVTAILLGALMIHGLNPGPELFAKSPAIVTNIYLGFILSYIVIFVISIFSIKLIARILNVKTSILSTFVLVFCLVGVYALQNSFFDIYVAIAFGLIGYFMRKNGFDLGSFTLAFILGSMIETKLALGLKISKGSFAAFFTRPISGTLLVITILFVVLSAVRIRKAARKNS